jgi:hypothetical protein
MSRLDLRGWEKRYIQADMGDSRIFKGFQVEAEA